ncbi:MAG: translation initiation factor eIF-2B [Thermoplasmata archaeon]|nr:translation initiation factor eIF-2B [Thermoplasmata archaeon]
MLGPVVEDAIERIAGDQTSSASRLARVALETMALAILERPGRKDPAMLTQVAQRLSEAQPAMAIVHNVVTLFARLVAEGHEPMEVLREIHAELDTAREKIGKTFLKVAPEKATVLTLSYSESVRACVLAAHGKRRIVQVLAIESAPAFEGRAMAKTLERDGVPAAIVLDDQGPERVRDATYVLVGADSVLRDGSVVNKRGTRALAEAAKKGGKPMYVACETMKFDARFEAGSRPQGQKPDLFDVTPGQLITTIVTERGAYTPDIVKTMLSTTRTPSS